MADNSSALGSGSFAGLIKGDAGAAQSSQGITSKAFLLNLAVGLGLFTFELSGFFLLKNAGIGRRIYQPKTYLVQDRLRVEPIPVNPLKWIQRIFSIKGEELKIKCGLDGYFFIRFIRAMIVIFLPLMAIIVTILFPVNFNGGKADNGFVINNITHHYNVTGLDTLSWQNVAPTQTNRYWAHLVCALLAISWTLYRIYREKLHYIHVRQQFLTSPEHRLKASARTILVTNIPSEYRSVDALKALYDVFADNDDRSKLNVWVNRDYKSLRALTNRRRKLCHALEKHELKLLRLVNKQNRTPPEDVTVTVEHSKEVRSSEDTMDDETDQGRGRWTQDITNAFYADCKEDCELWHKYLKSSKAGQMSIIEDDAGGWKPASSLKFWASGNKKTIPKAAWLRKEIALLTIQIEEMLNDLDNETRFVRQNSAFIQFDRQMVANMASSLVSHQLPGRMTPRFMDVAPHEVLWPNMGVTSLGRFIKTLIALVLFLFMIVFWGIPTTFLGILSQLDSLRATTKWLYWLRPWPSWIISLISGPLSAILLALLIQLVVPALCRKLAVLVGAPTRSKREVVTQSFYFAFLFIELVLVTSISSGIVATIPVIVENPTTIPTTLATDLPKAANYFFNYLIIQALGFSGSVLFQYLRLLYITTIWPFFTQTPREEAFLQTTIPHQMWGNVYALFTNFAAIGLIYSIIAPLMLIIISINFMLFWIAYRHNYYYVQRNKVDTHGMLFENALSQLFSGVYVLEATLIGLFFLVRDEQDNVACAPQAIIMIVALVLTAAFHYLLEMYLQPLYELLPVTLEDTAADAERRRLFSADDSEHTEVQDEARQDDSVELAKPSSESEKHQRLHEGGNRFETMVQERLHRAQMNDNAGTAAKARNMLSRLKQETAERQTDNQAHVRISEHSSKRREVEDKLGAAIAGFPDELLDLSYQEREAELKAAYQDPVTRQPPPIIWIPQDKAKVSEDTLNQAKKYGKYLQYSNDGAFLTKRNKVEITQPAPDVRPDWLLDWVL